MRKAKCPGDATLNWSVFSLLDALRFLFPMFLIMILKPVGFASKGTKPTFKPSITIGHNQLQRLLKALLVSGFAISNLRQLLPWLCPPNGLGTGFQHHDLIGVTSSGTSAIGLPCPGLDVSQDFDPNKARRRNSRPATGPCMRGKAMLFQA